jgi:hypothetical protein
MLLAVFYLVVPFMMQFAMISMQLFMVFSIVFFMLPFALLDTLAHFHLLGFGCFPLRCSRRLLSVSGETNDDNGKQ